MKTVFSGMSEAFHRLSTGDLAGAFAANFLAPPFAVSLVVSVLWWKWPRVERRSHEVAFFSLVIAASIAVNLVHGDA